MNRELLLVLGLVYLMSDTVSSLSCYSCYNCNLFEPASQARDCAPQEKYCVKVELLTGEVNRLCATEEKCKQDVKEPTANCCTEDKCNSSPRPSSPPPLLLSLLLLTLYSRR